MSELVLTEDQRDCLQELCNVAMGQAGDALARRLGDFVILPIPQVKLLAQDQLAKELTAFRGDVESLSGVSQKFSIGGLEGQLLLLFSDTSFHGFAERFPGIVDNDDSERALLLNLVSVLHHTCLQGIAEQLELVLEESDPKICAQHSTIEDLILSNTPEETLLSVEINYHLESFSLFNCDLLFLVSEQNIPKVLAKIDELLD